MEQELLVAVLNSKIAQKEVHKIKQSNLGNGDAVLAISGSLSAYKEILGLITSKEAQPELPRQTRNELQEVLEKYPKGRYIRKANFSLFSNRGKLKATEKINRVEIKGGQICINFKNYPIESLPVLITLEEKLKLDEEWDNIYAAPVGESESPDFEHYREENGDEKLGLGIKHAKQTLFTRSHQNPEGNYKIYNCGKCGKIHIGRSKIK